MCCPQQRDIYLEDSRRALVTLTSINAVIADGIRAYENHAEAYRRQLQEGGRIDTHVLGGNIHFMALNPSIDSIWYRLNISHVQAALDESMGYTSIRLWVPAAANSIRIHGVTWTGTEHMCSDMFNDRLFQRFGDLVATVLDTPDATSQQIGAPHGGLVLAGGTVQNLLRPRPLDTNGDLDFFPHGFSTPWQAGHAVFAAIQRVATHFNVTSAVFTPHTLTVHVEQEGRHATTAIQFILTGFVNVHHVLANFDLDCCCAAYDGNTVLCMDRFLWANKLGTNFIMPSRASCTLPYRSHKYGRRGFTSTVALPSSVPCVTFQQGTSLAAHQRGTLTNLAALVAAQYGSPPLRVGQYGGMWGEVSHIARDALLTVNFLTMLVRLLAANWGVDFNCRLPPKNYGPDPFDGAPGSFFNTRM
jgi:hypothetical protein